MQTKNEQIGLININLIYYKIIYKINDILCWYISLQKHIYYVMIILQTIDMYHSYNYITIITTTLIVKGTNVAEYS